MKAKLARFNPKVELAIDTETTGIDVWGKDIPFMVSMCDEKGVTWACTWPVDPFTRKVKPNPADVAYIRSFTENQRYSKVFHNSKFDVAMLKKVGIKVKGKIHDTLFKARVCYTLEMSYGLKWLSKYRLGIDDTDEKDLQKAVVDARRKAKMYNNRAAKEGMTLIKLHTDLEADYWLPAYFDPEHNLCEEYCRQDVYRTMALSKLYDGLMQEDSILLATYRKEMEQIWPIVNSMEKRGMKVFPQAVEEESTVCRAAMRQHMTAMLQTIKEQSLKPFPPDQQLLDFGQKKISRLKNTKPNPQFNPSSPKQLMRILYLPKGEGGLGLQTDRRSKKTGKVTTDKDTLRELMYEPFVRELAGYRAARHTLTLFFEKFNVLMRPDSLEAGSMVMHPGFNQCGTKTGRFSCNQPNLQQVSAGSKKSLSASYNGAKVFGPRNGYAWLCADYSQQEGRIFAYLAQVPVMLDALASGTDLFRAMSDKIWGGKNNPNSLKACIQALELTKTSLPENQEVAKVWEKYGWFPGTDIDYASTVSDNWLREFDYSIVTAEASLGKEACRQRCKHITYAKIFGGGPGSYTHLLYCSLEEAKKFDTEYNASMPEMKQFMKRLETQANQDGFIVNLYQRKLRVDSGFGYRAVSYMIQGSAADQMKSSIIKVNKYLKGRPNIDGHLLVTIHDSLIVEVREDQLDETLMLDIKILMEDTSDGGIGLPMPVGMEVIHSGGRWGRDEEKVKL